MSKDIMKNCITCTCTREHTSLVKFNVQTTPHNQILSLRRKQPFLSCVGFHSTVSLALLCQRFHLCSFEFCKRLPFVACYFVWLLVLSEFVTASLKEFIGLRIDHHEIFYERSYGDFSHAVIAFSLLLPRRAHWNLSREREKEVLSRASYDFGHSFFIRTSGVLFV